MNATRSVATLTAGMSAALGLAYGAETAAAMMFDTCQRDCTCGPAVCGGKNCTCDTFSSGHDCQSGGGGGGCQYTCSGGSEVTKCCADVCGGS